MRRSTVVVLILMGGPLIGGAGTVMLSPLLQRQSQACRDARAAQDPDADELCRISHGSSGGHVSNTTSSTTFRDTTGTGVHAGSSSTASTSVSRGGFGGAGATAASGGG